MKFRLILHTVVTSTICGLAWVGGFDFDTRGPAALMVGFAVVALNLSAFFLVQEVHDDTRRNY